ncbi:sulfatase-like hydrolase/transferase [Rhodopirellula sp. SWK7]|uniref:sulfatase-like hydrolase/transferase n=1 Tax=Rhodopirellula sp. SWK7 TaxID=595460 RepID=UPI0002BD8D9E|nr:sulfatase-like hydrolase/transferase [Rhodopirellula sp. SWK7]EMI45771.1 secreted protein containing Sulfatase domain protein [Rhodopirellula sp. SWK7]
MQPSKLGSLLPVVASIGWFATCIACGPVAHADQSESTRPNIIVIMADDLGYGDVGCYGGTGVSTSAIDGLASRGLRFTQAYCSAGTCTPSRYSLLTGVYAFRVPGSGIAPPDSPALIPAGTPSIASVPDITPASSGNGISVWASNPTGRIGTELWHLVPWKSDSTMR